MEAEGKASNAKGEGSDDESDGRQCRECRKALKRVHVSRAAKMCSSRIQADL
jgi:hypothetical protein